MILTIRVKIKSKKPGVEKISETEYVVRVSSAPVDGAANKEIILLLSRYLNCSQGELEIIRGEKSRIKTIRKAIP